jgi:hypothetical protein
MILRKVALSLIERTKMVFAVRGLDNRWAILVQLVYDVDRALGSLGPRPARWPHRRSPWLAEH